MIWFCLHAGVSSAMVDVNTNGLSDVWENVYALTPLDPAADPDGDGQSNLQESIAGTDPFNAASVFRVQAVEEPSALLLRWPSVAGRRYQIETAASFASGGWQPRGPVVAGTGGEVIGAVPLTKQAAMACRLRVVAEGPVLFAFRPEFLHDTDGDGASDLSEYGAGTDPFDTNSCLRITSCKLGKAVRLSWIGVEAKQYVVESATNSSAAVWSDLTGIIPGVTGTMTVTVIPQARQQFFRVRVSDGDVDGDGVTDWEAHLVGLDTGPLRFGTNSSTRVPEVSAMLNSPNTINLEVDRPTANATTLEPASFRVTRAGNVAPLTIHYATYGTAVPGMEYQPVWGTIDLPAGARTADIPIVPLAGAELAPAKTVGVVLLAAPGYALGTNTVAEISVVREVALSVKDFGAVGDGVADDTAAIQSAINALEASTTHNTLHFPAGVYRLNSPTNESEPTFAWNYLLKLGNTELAGRDLFFTGAPGATLYSTVTELRAHVLMARARFRSLTFRGLNWAKVDTALPEIQGEANLAAGLFVLNYDARRVEAVEFRRCGFDNCHGAVDATGVGFDLRGRLARFGFFQCGVTNRYGPNTTNAWLASSGGQQVRLNPWVGTATYDGNFFYGGSGESDPIHNPGGRLKDGSHFGSPLRLYFTNNVVRNMGVEAVHQVDDPYMATTASGFVIPPPGGGTAESPIFATASTFTPGQLLNYRAWFFADADPTNVFLRVVAYDPARRTITVTNSGLTPGVAGLVVPSWNNIYLSEYNPTDVWITGNLIENVGLYGLSGITANARATLRANTIIGFEYGIFTYENPRNPLYPPTAGMVIDSNVILSQSTLVNTFQALGIVTYGPGETVINNLILTPFSGRFRGIVTRDNDTWIQGNTVIAADVMHYGYDSPSRSSGIGFGQGTTNGTAVANRTHGFDVGVGPEGAYQIIPHRVIGHISLDDALAVDPLGLVP